MIRYVRGGRCIFINGWKSESADIESEGSLVYRAIGIDLHRNRLYHSTAAGRIYRSGKIFLIGKKIGKIRWPALLNDLVLDIVFSLVLSLLK